jgi:Zn-dependent M28 family amino/carboxypeptidase
MSEESLEYRLRHHVHTLSAEIGERNVFRPHALWAAADYIRAEWRTQGYQVASQSYRAEGVNSENLEITRTGSRKPDEILLIGAHYDSVMGSPGANDNGSGVAALLEISRFMAGLAPEKTVRLVAFVNEEPPFFYWGPMGSLVYAKAARKRGDDIRLMISLEMLGCFSDEPDSQSYPPLLKYFYPNRGNFIAFVSNLRSRKVLKQAVAAFRVHSDFPCESLAAPYFIPGVGWSDQLSFWRQGYRAIMVTDTAFYRYAYYHTGRDTAEKLNYPAMARVVEGLQKAVGGLAG